MLTPEQLARLSKTAQRHIATLEMRLDEAHKRLAVGAENSDTFSDIYRDAPRGLGKSAAVAFGCAPDAYGLRPTFTVRLEGADKLYVTCSVGLVSIEPQSANSFHVRAR